MSFDSKRVFVFALSLVCTVAATVWLARHASAQVPVDLEAPLRRIGTAVDPAASRALYAPRLLEQPPFPGADFERGVAFGGDAHQRLDVVQPGGTTSASAPRPVLVFVHGDEDDGTYDNVMLWAVRHGAMGVNLDHRRAPPHAWPAAAQDIGAAVAWVHAHIAERGGNPAQIFLLGHGSGASHVAAYVAHDEFHGVPGSGVAGAMLLSGVYRVSPALVAESPAAAAYFGTEADAMRERSSVTPLLISTVPLWVGGAELDPPQLKQQAMLLRSAMDQAQTPCDGQDFQGHGHWSTVYSLHTDDSRVGETLLGFMRKHAGADSLAEVPVP